MAYGGEKFIPGHYCRNCGWLFTSSQRQSHCQVKRAFRKQQEFPLDQRNYCCPNRDRVHPEWRDRHSRAWLGAECGIQRLFHRQ
jgi:hypothetical protein